MPTSPSSSQPTFADRIVTWQQSHGRHDLPWQKTRDPYPIWVSEIMLQQTQVATVIPYFERFLQRFPTVEALATAPTDAVLEAWSGLGYYARARNLQRCAQQVVGAGGWPRTADQLAVLAGIGRSTAAAIAVFAFGERAAILDGNVKRVLARHAGIAGDPGQADVQKRLWSLAEAFLPAVGIEAYTQGLMDLGATLCGRAKPRCGDCPVGDDCVARRDGRQDELPTARRKPPLPERTATFVLVTDGDSVLLERRPPSGLWGGLLVPPEGDPQLLLNRIGAVSAEPLRLPPLRHSFTHFRLLIEPVLCRVAAAPPIVCDGAAWVWLARAHIDGAALPTPVRRLLQAMPDASATG